ncbi:tetratricopeptide repeat protein [Terracidiphilus gabretensis]|uniref:tetratricopeptide repeat protein n=1 Tax=Terracidiphilus gabretensis TaxID=1577687 RepID=UPI00071B6ADC|nr:tetratricopeptide repeat protein [Terracidiphilus gabretensis]
MPGSYFHGFLCALILAGPGAAAHAQTNPAIDPILIRAEHLRAQHKPDEAATLLRPYVEQHPGNAAALVLLGDTLLDLNQTEQAGQSFAHALAAVPDSIPANLAAGEFLLSQHNDPEAMDRFETILAQDSHHVAARKGEVAAATELAVTSRRDNHPDLALVALRHACEKLPDSPELQLDRGLQAFELNQLPEADEALHAARKLDPANLAILYALARLETQQQHMPEAERDYKAYLAARPNDATAHYGLGYTYAALLRTEDARHEFEASIRLQPQQTESYYQLGQLALDAHHDDEAKPLFERVLTRDPNHAGALTGLGELAFRGKDYATAEQLLARAEKSDPSYTRPHYYRGLALARLGRNEEALRELQQSDGRTHAISSPADTTQAPP